MLTYFADWALDVSNNSTGWVIQKFNTDLGDVSGTSGSAKNLGDLCKLNWLILKIEKKSDQHICQHGRERECGCARVVIMGSYAYHLQCQLTVATDKIQNRKE